MKIFHLIPTLLLAGICVHAAEPAAAEWKLVWQDEFDGTNIASGIYFYRIISEGEGQKFTKTLKMVLVK